jgi:hypothetical protein
MIGSRDYERWFNEEATKLQDEYGVVYLSKHRERMAERWAEELGGLPAPLRWLAMLRIWLGV